MKAAPLAIVGKGLRAALALLFSAILWIGLLLIGGAVLVLGGIHMMFGLAWTLIAAGLACLGFAVVVILGARNA